MNPQSSQKTSTWSAVNFKKHLTSMSCKLEPAIWSRDTGQRIPCFDRCQLIITWMSNIKEVHSKSRLHVSVNLLFGVWQPSCATHRRRRRRRRAHAPTSNTASHDNHEKINWWVSFCFPYEYGAPLGGPSGRRSSVMNFTLPQLFWNPAISNFFPSPLGLRTRNSRPVWFSCN